jgi:predicted RNA-binding protein YlqC (UPF0109 family)
MKKFLIAVMLVISGLGSMAAGKSINEKLVQKFRESYPNAVQVDWREYSETYAVYFKIDSVRSNIIFSKNGSFIKAFRYYGEDYLPYYLAAAIHGKYPKMKIHDVTEVSTPDSIEYYIKLEDAKTWMTIKLDSEANITHLDKFRKA